MRIAGKLPAGKYLESLRQSPNFKKKGFENLSPTPMMAEDASYWKMTREFFRKNKNAKPPGILPGVKTDLSKLNAHGTSLVWFGHSSYLIRSGGKNFLIDPVFSGNAAPLSFMVKAFRGSDIYKTDDMPSIDYLVLTHDHYDHLDYKTIRRLRNKAGKIYCSLGIASHLKYWGVDEDRIEELDWWESKELEKGFVITAAPARHFSGRGLKRGQSLWSSFILRTPDHNLYLGGDSGYDSHFKEIGDKFGPFDLALLEAGQYNTMWPLIHMMPEETVQAALDLKTKMLIPVHWGKFSLAMHAWNEPVMRVVKKAAEVNLKVVTPKIGEVVVIGADQAVNRWWDM